MKERKIIEFGKDDWQSAQKNVEFAKFERKNSLEKLEGGRDRNETK